MKTLFLTLCTIAVLNFPMSRAFADEDSAYDENPNYSDTDTEDISPSQQKFDSAVGYMIIGGVAVMLISSFQANREKKKKEKLEIYQQDELKKFEQRFKAGLTKWNTTSQKTRNQAGGIN